MRKKLFAVIMSVMMMVTFMPAMAFAGHTCDASNSRIVLTGWSKTYSEANFAVICNDADCTLGLADKTIKTFSVETTRLFDGERVANLAPFKYWDGDSWESFAWSQSGAIFTFVKTSDVVTAAENVMKRLTSYTWNVGDECENISADYQYLGDDVFLTTYYDFKDAQICDFDGTVYSKLGADDYLDSIGIGNYVKFLEPTDIDSYDGKKQNFACSYHQLNWISFHEGECDYYDYLTLANTEELAVGHFIDHNMSNPGDRRDVRVEIEYQDYIPYDENVTVEIPVKFIPYSDIQEDKDLNVINTSTEGVQKVFIDTTTENIDLTHFVYHVKGESASADSVQQFYNVYKTESEAKRYGVSYILDDLVYNGADQCFEITTHNVSVQYGAIDKVGNVTWSDEAPIIKDVKYTNEGFYQDDNYHFLVKITKGNKTRYAHIEVIVNPAILDLGFNQSAYVYGKNETINKKDLLAANVLEGFYSADNSFEALQEALNLKRVDVYEADKAIADELIDKYVTVNNASTDKLGEKTMTFSYDKTAFYKDAEENEALEQFDENYDFFTTFADYSTFLKNNKKDSLLEVVKGYIYPKTAKLTVGDVANQIRISNKTKTFHVKKAAKLKSTKKFQLKAKANYGKVTFKKVTSRYAKIKISKTGKVTVKKGLKKGTYKVKFKAYAPNKTVSRVMVIKIKK